jgi:SAM-dependent methyltransferase
MTESPQRHLATFYESCLSQFGDNYRGVGWTKSQEHANRRYEVMLDVMRSYDRSPVSLLDFGCGAAHLLDYIQERNVRGIEYCGLDVSSTFIELCKSKHPDVDFLHADILSDDIHMPMFDFSIINGIFTCRRDISYGDMFEYWRALTSRVFAYTRVGMAFNVMSTHVDWQRDDLFHVPIGDITADIAERLSRQFTIRHDYGLFEYTVYVYR